MVVPFPGQGRYIRCLGNNAPGTFAGNLVFRQPFPKQGIQILFLQLGRHVFLGFFRQFWRHREGSLLAGIYLNPARIRSHLGIIYFLGTAAACQKKQGQTAAEQCKLFKHHFTTFCV